MVRLAVLAVASVFLASPAPPALDLEGTTSVGRRLTPDAVVWLEAPAGGPERRRAVLDQRNLGFSPRVLVVQVGTRVEFPNHDRVFHNVFSFKDGKRFDLGLYPVGAVKEVPFDTPGLSKVFCNIHPQMSAYVLVVDSPYFAVSDAGGRIRIADVPVGSYRYHAWRPGGDVITDTVQVRAGVTLDVRWAQE